MDRGAAGDARQLAIGGRIVACRFERQRRRTIALRVDAHGLAVAAPHRAPWRDVERFIQQKARWILARLDAWAAAERPRTIAGASGERLPLFGSEVTLQVSAGPAGVLHEGERVRVQLARPEQPGAVRALLTAWLRGIALEALTPRVAHFAERLALAPPPVAISNARTQWGACTASGRVRLAWRLVHLHASLADYVVAHEVAHLVELNHSKRFWAVVETLYPDWRAARREMHRAAAALPLI